MDLGASLRTRGIRKATTDDVTEDLTACTSRPVALSPRARRITPPPLVCGAFKTLLVSKRKELISTSKRCCRCLAASHRKINCPNVRRCGLSGCTSDEHSRYLHENAQEAHKDGSAQPVVEQRRNDEHSNGTGSQD